MPKLGQKFTKKVMLPGYPENDPAWVEVLTNPAADLWDGLDESDAKSASFQVMSKIIVDWNFQDDAGGKAPITLETVKKLSVFDMDAINKAVGITQERLDTTQKKS
jgi:hypothetical protein